MKIQVLALALFGALFSCSATAGTASSPTVAAVKNGYQVVYGTNGIPLAVSSRSAAASGRAGEAFVLDMFKVPGPGGTSLDIASKRAVPWASIAGKLARGAGWIGAGMLAYEIYDKMRVKPKGDEFVIDDGRAPFDRELYDCSGSRGASPFAACQSDLNKQVSAYQSDLYYGKNQSWKTPVTCYEGSSPSSGACSGIWQTSQGTKTIISSWTKKVHKVCNPPDSPGLVTLPDADGRCPTGDFRPIDAPELETKLDKEPGVKEQVVPLLEEMLKRGVDVETSPKVDISGAPKVEMPPKVTTTTKPDGTTQQTVVREVSNITYEGDTYTWNTTTITNNPDGTKEEKPKEPEVTPPIDTSLPERPKLYEQKYKDGIKGVWDKEMAGIKNTPIFQFLSSMNPGLGDAGCPKWGFPGGDFMGLRFASGDVSLPCSVWFALKAVIIVSAFLLARRLVFGG